MQETGFEEVEACVLRRHNMAVQYIAMRQIMDLCKETVQILRMWVVKRLWEKEVLDLVGSVGSDGGIRRRGGGGRDGGRSIGSSRTVNHRIN